VTALVVEDDGDGTLEVRARLRGEQDGCKVDERRKEMTK